MSKHRRHMAPVERKILPATREELVGDLIELGIRKGEILHAKVSMREVGPVDGGAQTLIDAILEAIGPDGTLVSDAFIPMYPLPFSRGDAERVAHDKSPTYAGAFCAAMVNHPSMVRSQHPIQKGVAIGARAEHYMMGHTPEHPAYDHLHKMAIDGGRHITVGKTVVGVGTTHVAQNLLNLKQTSVRSGVYYRNGCGEIELFEKNWVGGCGDGFPKFFPLYRKGGAIVSEGLVGQAQCMVTDMKRTLEIELDRLAVEPSFFFCDDPGCTYCRLSWEFSTGRSAVVLLHRFIRDTREQSMTSLMSRAAGWLRRCIRT
jgi:aminoglycoside 3-N-acetyltransferase